ncbi:unnamed protein product [Echinostoma caproni]|uniref:MOSC domain-containing protein n=1 Tax=Echinostoma caproni TaxID=27848 RepID=A0A183AQF2_9TREM|nr:unnamed protein product [Echinostoma caproni]
MTTLFNQVKIQGVLRIHVIAGRNLKAGDKSVVGRGSSDPYCIVRVNLQIAAPTLTRYKDQLKVLGVVDLAAESESLFP